jgi:hypothetical protein
MKRPSTLSSSASPRPVPAAMTAPLQDGELVPFEHRDRRRHRFQIVQDVHVAEACAWADLRRVDQPGHVRHARNLIGHRAGNAERRGFDVLRIDVVRFQELANHRDEAAVVERDEFPDFNRCRPLGRAVEKSEQRLRSADVSGQQHAPYYS